MGIEIERKFLVKDYSFKELALGETYRQGYICSEHSRTVRIRVCNNKGFITIKGKTTGITRLEYEYEIPVGQAEELLNNICEKPLIDKLRYKIKYEGFIWEVDEFFGENEGLIVAEIELTEENIDFPKPDWIDQEVSSDYRYSNSNLTKNPYKYW